MSKRSSCYQFHCLANVHKNLQQDKWRRISLFWVLALTLCAGCATQGSYKEAHNVKDLNIVFVDQHTMHQEWVKRTGTPGVRFGSRVSANTGMPGMKTVNGFYDFATRTIYCPKWNFEICGHELHHAVLGQFHHQD